jgi:LuxR family maltose regulon positive regulatory protein
MIARTHQLPACLARALLAQNKGTDALRAIEGHRRTLEVAGRAQEVLVIIHHANGQVDNALQLLRGCVRKAQSQGSIRLFVDEGAPMQTMLRQLSNEKGIAPYVAQLLDAFGTQATQEERVAVPAAATSSHLPLSAFSDRELEVLRLIQQGHSNQNIGELLFLSLSTVKWHNQNIFSKLDVQRRTEAVARAVQLQLL